MQTYKGHLSRYIVVKFKEQVLTGDVLLTQNILFTSDSEISATSVIMIDLYSF